MILRPPKNFNEYSVSVPMSIDWMLKTLQKVVKGENVVTKIIAGTNITISPVGGTGQVTINASVPATPTLAQVTTAGNTTTNAITVGGLTINNNTINSQISVESNRGTGASVFVSANFRNTNATSNKVQFTLGGGTVASGESRTFSFGTDVNGAGVKDFFIYNGGTLQVPLLITPSDNIKIGYGVSGYVDAGYKLDVNGTVRLVGNLTLNGRLQENLVFDTITGSIRTIEFKNVGGGLYPSVGGAARIKGEFGDFYWQAAGGNAMQLGAYHEIVLQGGRAVSTDLSFITGSSAAYNVRVLNTNASSVALAIQGVTSQTGDLLRIDSTSATSNGSTFVVKSNGNILINTTTDAGQKLQVSGKVFIKGTTSLTATKVFEVQNGAGESIMDFRDSTYAFFGCGQGGGSATGFIFNYSNTSYCQFSGYNYGAGAGAYKPILLDTDIVGRGNGVFVNFGVSTNPPPNSDTEFGVRGRTSDTMSFIARFRNSSNTDMFEIRADGALFTDGQQGYSGTLTIPGNPPGSTTITITNGLITNIA